MTLDNEPGTTVTVELNVRRARLRPETQSPPLQPAQNWGPRARTSRPRVCASRARHRGAHKLLHLVPSGLVLLAERLCYRPAHRRKESMDHCAVKVSATRALQYQRPAWFGLDVGHPLCRDGDAVSVVSVAA